MVLRKLTRKELRIIYKIHLMNDFPRCEIKPLHILTDGMKQGNYVCFGGFDEKTGELLCYCVVMLGEKGGMCLLDYFAVVRGKRDAGVGSQALSLLGNALPDSCGLFVEYENPDAECGDAEKRRRREAFYLRNGLRRTDIRIILFGVPFIIGYLPIARDLPDPELRLRLQDMYRRFRYGSNVRFIDR